MPDGSYQAEIYPGPVNYQDASGTWQPIDDSLVASDQAGYATKNQAGPYDLELPADLGAGPIKVTANGSWASYQLLGAHGAGQVSGSTDTFRQVLTGVDVAVTAQDDGVQERTILASATAASRFVYSVATSPDLTPTATNGGGIAFVGANGHTVLAMPAPVAQDAAGIDGPVSMSLQTGPTGTSIVVTADASWLASRNRVFPVTIDPSVSLNATLACYISGVQTWASFCTGPGSNVNALLVGYDSRPPGGYYRTLLNFPSAT